jgi:hypothetical protein
MRRCRSDNRRLAAATTRCDAGQLWTDPSGKNRCSRTSDTAKKVSESSGKGGRERRFAALPLSICARARTLLLAALYAGSSNALTPFGLRNAYRGILASHPTLTHCAQGAAVAGTGDLGSQFYLSHRQGVATVDTGRIARTSLTGVIYNGLLLPPYYAVIQKAIPGRNLPQLALKVVIDGLIWG